MHSTRSLALMEQHADMPLVLCPLSLHGAKEEAKAGHWWQSGKGSVFSIKHTKNIHPIFAQC